MRTTILLCAVISLAACEVQQVEVKEPALVTVQGEARTEVVPDLLDVRLSVERTDEDMDAATAEVNRRVNAALDAIRATGVADEDLRALAIQVRPVYDYVDRRQEFRGHHVARSIEFRLRDLDEWPALAEALIEARVDRIERVQAGHSDAEGLRREALRDAVADAIARATVLAEAAGARVGPAWRIDEQQRGFAAPRMETMQLRAADTAQAAQWEAGTITVTANVQASFELERR